MSKTADLVREAGYETLFFLGGFLALSAHPTHRNMDRIHRWIDETQARRQLRRRLEQNGLIESIEVKGQWAMRLTAKGHTAIAGGRDPQQCWKRSWDGNWRLLTFDLPRAKSQVRMRLWRWLSDNHFGHLQGSVWVTPDPNPGLTEFLGKEGIDLEAVLMFEGDVVGKHSPRDVSASAWNFDELNQGYREYSEMAERLLQSLKKGPMALAEVRRILQNDRKAWWAIVRRDPLLPQVLCPSKYQGPAAWRLRCRLLKKLGHTCSVGPECGT